MGNCCGGSSYEDITPDRDTIRQQQAAAAEKRMADQMQRGIGNINAVKYQQRMTEQREKTEREVGHSYNKTPLKWQMN